MGFLTYQTVCSCYHHRRFVDRLRTAPSTLRRLSADNVHRAGEEVDAAGDCPRGKQTRKSISLIVEVMWLNDLGHPLRMINFPDTKEVSNERQTNFFSRIQM